jgi:hypothetical protein
MPTEKSTNERTDEGICNNCGERSAISLKHPLIFWCRKCRTPEREAGLELIRERNKALLAKPGLNSQQRLILTCRHNGIRMSYIAQRLGITLKKAEHIETQLLQAALN